MNFAVGPAAFALARSIPPVAKMKALDPHPALSQGERGSVRIGGALGFWGDRHDALADLHPWSTAEIQDALQAALVDGLGLKPRNAYGPVRVAVTVRWTAHTNASDSAWGSGASRSDNGPASHRCSGVCPVPWWMRRW